MYTRVVRSRNQIKKEPHCYIFIRNLSFTNVMNLVLEWSNQLTYVVH